MKPDVLIIGAGIVGMTAALALRDKGARVSLIDAGVAGQGSTWAGGGMISPVPPWKYPEAVQRLVARSQSLYPALIETLEAATGIACEYRHSGLLLLGDALAGGDEWLAGHPVQQGAAGDFAPALADRRQAAILIPGIAQVRNSRLAHALAGYLRSLNVEIFEHTQINTLSLEHGAVRGVETADRRIEAASVVLAAGAWTGRLLERSGLDGLGIEPVKGQILLFHPGNPLINQVIADGRHYLIPRADGRILCGSTIERAGFDSRPTHAAYETLRRAAVNSLPALADVVPQAHWAGLRPGIAGEVPVIGPYPEVEGLWISAGHYRNGLGMAPAAAELLAWAMQDEL